jgi:hypothetical protein
LTVRSAGAVVALPASRKARALLAYLALSPHPVLRSRLCELLWDLPDDPRGELRWSLSRIRSFLDSPGRHRVETRMDTIGLDLTDCFVDVTEIDQTARSGLATIATNRLRVLAALFTGELLEGWRSTGSGPSTVSSLRGAMGIATAGPWCWSSSPAGCRMRTCPTSWINGCNSLPSIYTPMKRC